MKKKLNTLKIFKLLKKGIFYFLTLFLISFLVSVIKSILFDIYIVQAQSMNPTLRDNEYIYVSKYAYNIKTPEYLPFTNVKIPFLSFNGLEEVKRGDIAIFKLPIFMEGKKCNYNVNVVKRIVGLPGDTVVVDNKNIESQSTCASNDTNKLEKIYLRIPRKDDTILSKNISHQFIRDLILGEGHTFEKKKDNTILIDGKPSLFYIVEKDYYFMKGDNESNSIDSRCWGFLPKERLIGRVIY